MAVPCSQLEEMIATNLLGSFYTCRAVVKQMLKQKEGKAECVRTSAG